MASFGMDKLSYEIFSILENKFLLSPDTKPVNGKVRILSIDSGEDCLLAAVALVRLESSIRSLTGNPDARIADFFDVAAGSGLGGVLATMLFTRGPEGNPLFSAEEALNFLSNNHRQVNNKRGIFRRSSKEIFRKMFDESTTLRDTLKPVLIPCYDLSTGAPFMFSRADAMETDAYDFRMGQVCAAACADHRPVELCSVDRRTKVVAVGSRAAMSNPTAAAITHVLNNKQEFPLVTGAEDLLVLSLGSDGKIGSKVPDVAKIASNAAADTVDQAVAMAFVDRSNYVRIQGNLGYKNIESVLFRGRRISEQTNAEKLEEVCGRLVKEQQRRASSRIPTVMIKQQQTVSPRTSSATTCTTVTSITTSTNEICR